MGRGTRFGFCRIGFWLGIGGIRDKGPGNGNRIEILDSAKKMTYVPKLPILLFCSGNGFPT